MTTAVGTSPALAGEVRSPATGEPIGTFAPTSPEELEQAVTSVADTFDRTTWRCDARTRVAALTAWADALEHDADRLARLLVTETGKLLVEAQFEVRGAVDALRYNAGMARYVGGRAGVLPDGSTAHLERQPVGPTAFIAPWNFPVYLLLRDLAPALAAGVTAVVKPSELTPFSTVDVVSLAASAGMPPGVIEVVQGGADLGRALVEHPRIRAISFTGSTAVGQRILAAAAPTMKRTLLELGGKGCNVVFADGDLEAAVANIMRTAFIGAGQMCIATTRVLVEDRAYDRILEALVDQVGALRVGDPLDPSTDLAPLISPSHRDRVAGYVDQARATARVLVGGDRIGEERPAFLSPALVTDVDPASPLVQDEIFGPVLTVERFADEDQAARLANGVPFGLSAGLWTSDVRRAWSVARALEAGSVWVNGYMTSHAEMPSGGFKQSGLGRTRGIEGIEQFTELKHINWA